MLREVARDDALAGQGGGGMAGVRTLEGSSLSSRGLGFGEKQEKGEGCVGEEGHVTGWRTCGAKIKSRKRLKRD